jgi:hypothetical protein
MSYRIWSIATCKSTCIPCGEFPRIYLHPLPTNYYKCRKAGLVDTLVVYEGNKLHEGSTFQTGECLVELGLLVGEFARSVDKFDLGEGGKRSQRIAILSRQCFGVTLALTATEQASISVASIGTYSGSKC